MPFGRPTPQDDQRAIAYRDWIQQRNPFSIASVVLGIFSLLEFGAIPIFSLAAIILGIMALKGLKKRDGSPSSSSFTPTPSHPDTPTQSSPTPALGRRLAITGILLGTISFAIFIYLRTRPIGH